MGRISILMLEDSPLDAELVLARLDREKFDYEVEKVSTEREFRAALEDGNFDVILSDFSLPGFGGAAALEIAATARPQTPFIFVSGALGEEVAIETLKRGATDYVLKHRLERLGPAVRRALAESEEVRRRQAAEEALRQSEARYRLLAEATPNFVWATDRKGKLTFINRQFLAYAGMPAEEALRGEWTKAVHPDDLELVASKCRDAIEDREPCEFEFRCRRAHDGSYRWYFARLVPLEPEAGEGWQWLGTALDIESQKRAEQALRSSNEELQQFAFAASHDLQEPLRNISTFTQLLARRFEHKLDKEADEYIRFAVEGAKRMNALIHDLLSYARISMQDEPSQRVHMESILHGVLENLRLAIDESRAAITHDPLPEVTANPIQIFQVMQNLMSNAIKYRDPGRPLRVHITASAAPSEWVFSICDNGQGFDQAYADRVFGVFHRLHGREVPGTGIGLSICKRIIERHGGNVWAKARKGEGATFYFTLPSRHRAPVEQHQSL